MKERLNKAVSNVKSTVKNRWKEVVAHSIVAYFLVMIIPVLIGTLTLEYGIFTFLGIVASGISYVLLRKTIMKVCRIKESDE
jgi:hypothetical protein